MHNLAVIGIDIAKSVFQLQGNDEKGKALFKKKLSRKDLLTFLANQPRCVVAMEACGGAHYLGRKLRELGFDIRLISPQHVKPFVKGNKNDSNDAAAICEVAARPATKFVPLKEEWHQSVQFIHRMRDEQVARRTKLSNQTRGFLHEFGIVMRQGKKALRQQLIYLLNENSEGLPEELIESLKELSEELHEVEARIEKSDRRLKVIAEKSLECKRIMQIKGLGYLTATAIVAATPNPMIFKSGRQYAAWLGLVPRHTGTGGKVTIGHISKRGDSKLRSLLVHGGRAALHAPGSKGDRLSEWAAGIKERRGSNKAAVALANKNARIIWALLSKKEDYKPELAA